MAIAAVVCAQFQALPSCEARSLDDTEKAALAQTVSDFDTAMRDRQYERVVSTVPPRVIAAIAAKADIPAEQLASAMIDVMKTAMAAVKLKSFSMDMSNAEYKELPDGSSFALIPTQTVIDAGDKGRMSQKTHTLGLRDDGKWYLLRVNDVANLLILRDVYPEFAGVELPSGSMEILKK